MVEDLNSVEWQAFAAKLIKERLETPKTSIASPSFIARMTSSAAEPETATSSDADGDEPHGKPPGGPTEPGKG